MLEIFEWTRAGILRPLVTTFSLADAGEAHRFLESRESSGKLVLIPNLDESLT